MTDTGDAIATAHAVRTGRRTAREVAEEAIARIRALDGRLNAVIHTRFDEALAEIGAGLPDGPLRGVPLLVKDLGTQVAGLPSTHCSRLFAGTVARSDSGIVARYRRAGMVVLGTTNSAEFGKNVSTEPLLTGPTRNPWDTGRSAGGSSGGSGAAVAAGMVPVAHGSDGGGSIRIPAAMCGLFGLKPSRGRISPEPHPSALSGPVAVAHALTTSVRDSALLLDIASGHGPGDAFAAPAPARPFAEAARTPPGRLRIGWTTRAPGGPGTDEECAAAVGRTARLCAELGHDVEEFEPDYDAGEVAAISGVLMGAELAVTVDEQLERLGRELAEDDLEPFTRVMYEHYRALPATDLNRALRRAQETGWRFARAFTGHDVLLSPTLARPTPRLGELDTTRPSSIYELASCYSAFTSVYNVTGLPAMSVPAAGGELPTGVQFGAALGREDLLLSLAAQLEKAAPWPRHAPDACG